MNKTDGLKGLRIGFAMTGSFCTFSRAFEQMELLREAGAEILPIMSLNSSTMDTRFGKADEHIAKAEKICGKRPVLTINEAEPIGPKDLTDVLLIAPCTGNTLAKLSYSITDNAVTMAVKSHLRNARPVVVTVSTNDALAGSLKNIGYLMNMKNYYFVPFSQDDSNKKPTSLVGDFSMIPKTIVSAMQGRQIQPIIF